MKVLYLRYVLVIVIMAFSTVMSGQMRSGYKFGVNLTTLSVETKGINSMERPIGIHFGINYDIRMSRKFSFVSGFLFSSKGSDYRIDTVDFSLTPTYVELPANIAYTIGRRSTKISIYAGPYTAFAIGGYKIVGEDPLKYLTFGRSSNKDLRAFDFGFNFGAGLDLKGFVISVQYGIGLANISTANDSKMKNQVIGISISSLRGNK